MQARNLQAYFDMQDDARFTADARGARAIRQLNAYTPAPRLRVVALTRAAFLAYVTAGAALGFALACAFFYAQAHGMI